MLLVCNGGGGGAGIFILSDKKFNQKIDRNIGGF